METPIFVATPSASYFISDARVPTAAELPWGDQECDALVAILSPDSLNEQLAKDISSALLLLRTDWIETLGGKAESLHDLIDRMSVSIGRQEKVGDGDPMTAWDEDRQQLNDVVEYLRLGGQGASRNKLVIVVGPQDDRLEVAKMLQRLLVGQN